MNEEKLVKLLEKHFPTKKDFRDFKIEIYNFRKEIKEEFKNIDSTLVGIDNDIKEIKPSIKALDKILEQHPIERVQRLENHNHLPVFVPASQEE